MDKNTIKAFIVDCKDSGMTFQEISDKLNSEYDIQKTRQAIQKMYQRIKNKEKDDLEKVKIVADMVNIYCLGYNMTETTDILINMGYEINYTDVNKTINSNSDYIQDVEKNYLEKAIKSISIARSDLDVENILTYKDIKPTENKLKDYIKNAYKEIVKQSIEYKLAQVYQLTDDRATVKYIIDDLGLNIQLTDVLNKV